MDFFYTGKVKILIFLILDTEVNSFIKVVNKYALILYVHSAPTIFLISRFFVDWHFPIKLISIAQRSVR
jgi:hypothetical protein